MIRDCVHSLPFICLYTFHILVWPGYRMLKVYFMNLYAPYLINYNDLWFIFFLIPIRKCTIKHFGSFPVIFLSQFPLHLHSLVLFYKNFHGLCYTYWQGRSKRSCIRGEKNSTQGVVCEMSKWNERKFSPLHLSVQGGHLSVQERQLFLQSERSIVVSRCQSQPVLWLFWGGIG